jgi:serine/threonine protein kinase
MMLGRYEIIGDLGAGGMGRVQLAKSPNGALVVAKTSLSKGRDDDERLRDEARVGLRVSHQSIVETLDLFEADGHPVLVTAYVSGASLLDLRHAGAMHPGVVCRIGRQIAEALDVIHHTCDENGKSLRILHRDVTSGNVMLGHDGQARLIDLGIARSVESRADRTLTGCLRGTLRYLSPELFDNAEHSPQSDMWALGVVLWEALLGRSAMIGSEAECVGRILSGRVMQLDASETVDPKMERAIAQLLAKNPKDRPRRARDAAAVFAMFEKEYGDTQQLSTRAVLRAVGQPRVWLKDGSAESHKLLVERAAATFCCDPDQKLLSTGVVDVPPGALPPARYTQSAMPLSARRTDATGITEELPRRERRTTSGFGSDMRTHVSGDVSSSLRTAPPPPPAETMIEPPVDVPGERRTPADQILAYAQMLQGLDRALVRAFDERRHKGDHTSSVDDVPAIIGTPLPSAPAPKGDAAHARAVSQSRRVLVLVGALTAAVAALVVQSFVVPLAALALSRWNENVVAERPELPPVAVQPATEQPRKVEPPAPPPPRVEPQPALALPPIGKPLEKRALDKATLARVDNVAPPACFVAGVTQRFVYKNKKGTSVSTRRFDDVPEDFRDRVRCLPTQPSSGVPARSREAAARR